MSFDRDYSALVARMLSQVQQVLDETLARHKEIVDADMAHSAAQIAYDAADNVFTQAQKAGKAFEQLPHLPALLSLKPDTIRAIQTLLAETAQGLSDASNHKDLAQTKLYATQQRLNAVRVPVQALRDCQGSLELLPRNSALDAHKDWLRNAFNEVTTAIADAKKFDFPAVLNFEKALFTATEVLTVAEARVRDWKRISQTLGVSSQQYQSPAVDVVRSAFETELKGAEEMRTDAEAKLKSAEHDLEQALVPLSKHHALLEMVKQAWAMVEQELMRQRESDRYDRY